MAVSSVKSNEAVQAFDVMESSRLVRDAVLSSTRCPCSLCALERGVRLVVRAKHDTKESLISQHAHKQRATCVLKLMTHEKLKRPLYRAPLSTSWER